MRFMNNSMIKNIEDEWLPGAKRARREDAWLALALFVQIITFSTLSMKQVGFSYNSALASVVSSIALAMLCVMMVNDKRRAKKIDVIEEDRFLEKLEDL